MEPHSELEPGAVAGTYEVIEVPEPAPVSALTPTPKYVPLTQNRDYMLLWSGQIVSVLGTGAVQIVYPLLILSLTGSAAAAGIGAALGAVPYVVFSLPAGALVDRWNRKRVMIFCDIGRAIILASIPIAMVLNVLTIWQIYAASLLEGSLFVFFNIAEVAALTHVVPKAQLTHATAQNDAAFNTANLIAPTLGTFLYQTFGQAFPFILDSFSYVVSVISLWFIKGNFQTQRKMEKLHLLRDIREGLEWLWNRPMIRFMGFVLGGWNFCSAARTLMVIVLAQNIGATDAQIGIVFSIGGIGGVIGALIAPRVQRRFSFGQVYISMFWVSAILFPVYIIVPNVYLMGVIMALTFVAGSVFNVVQFSYRLALIPDSLQGRVNSAFRLLALGFQPVGAAVGGILIERSGVVPAILLYTVIMILLALASTLNPDIRHAKSPRHVATA